MTETSTRPLPTDRALLKAYLPPEPTDSAVAQARAGGRRLDPLIAKAAAALDQHDRDSRARVMALADAAVNGDALDAANLAVVTGERHVLVEGLERLQAARGVISQRTWAAQSKDPAYLAWTAACRQVTDEWERCMSAESEEQRFANLVAFTERHAR